MIWELIIDKAVKKYLKRIPKKDVERIIAAIEELPVNPYTGDIDKMEGEEDAWRRRIGSYRIFYEIKTKQKIINVYDLNRRTSPTY